MVPSGCMRSSLLSPLKFPKSPDTFPRKDCGMVITKLRRPNDTEAVKDIPLLKTVRTDVSDLLNKKTRLELEYVSLTSVMVAKTSSEFSRI